MVLHPMFLEFPGTIAHFTLRIPCQIVEVQNFYKIAGRKLIWWSRCTVADSPWIADSI